MPRRPKVDPEVVLNAEIQKLSSSLPADLIDKYARETGFIIREKKVRASLFLWNLILGFGASMQKSLAALKKRYCIIAAESLAPSTFFDRFTPNLVLFLQAILRHLLENAVRSGIPKKVLEHFKDVLIIDGTIVRLLDSLAKVFPGAGMPAGAKITTVISVATSNLYRMVIHAGKKADVKTLQLGSWVKNHLLLFDRGYFKYAVFERILKLGGHFITRLTENADPEIVAVNLPCPGNSIDLVGKRLRECLSALKRGVLDLMVMVEFDRREYKGKKTTATLTMRLVGIRNDETGEYHLYLTDLPHEAFPAEVIALYYRGRWFVELLFKELKSRYALDVIHTTKPEIVKALIYAAMITLVVSRRLFVGYSDAMAQAGEVVTTERWARFFVEHAGVLLRRILKASGIDYSEELLISMALRETISPVPLQERLEGVWDI